VLLGVVAGGLFLLGGGTVLAVCLAGRPDETPVAQRPQSAAPLAAVAPVEPPAAPPTAASAEPEATRPAPPDDPAPPPPADFRPRFPTAPEPPPLGPPPAARAAAPVAAPVAPRGWLPPAQQTEVNKAIDRGVAHLKKKQHASGAWAAQHPTAFAALPGLTLLECGVPAGDPRVQKAARYVRAHAGRLASAKGTYELSLALLFLDRLGEAKDRKLIRTIALRLVAGQLPDGGWSYLVPQLSAQEENKLEGFLERTRPAHLGRFVQLDDGRRVDPAQLNFSGVVRADEPNGPPAAPAPALPAPATPAPAPAARKPALTLEQARKAQRALPPRVRNIPAVVDATQTGSPGLAAARRGGSDNSNTQFATLALWAASRHGLPLERPIDLLANRFRQSQAPGGEWGYHTAGLRGTRAMTGAGLLGLAVGHGLSTADRVKDPQVEKGFRALAEHVGMPLGAGKQVVVNRRSMRVSRRSAINLYFLWTVERVGVLYGVREVGGKDWYRWGVELLLDAQKPDGSWQQGGYPGATPMLDSCLALLFLKRANLATDLTRKLEFVIRGKRPASSLPAP
jgi:hypothetical protein